MILKFPELSLLRLVNTVVIAIAMALPIAILTLPNTTEGKTDEPYFYLAVKKIPAAWALSTDKKNK